MPSLAHSAEFAHGEFAKIDGVELPWFIEEKVTAVMDEYSHISKVMVTFLVEGPVTIAPATTKTA